MILIIFGRARMMSVVLPGDDDMLKEELPRLFLRCLGIVDNA